MSTDLYGLRVNSINPEKNIFQLRVFVVYYDPANKSHQPIPNDASFFLRVLWDKGDSRFGQGGSIGKEISVDQITNEHWVDHNTFRFIQSVEKTAIYNFPVENYSLYSDFYYDRDGVWEDEGKLVQAQYTVQVTNSKYLDHLTSGMSWGSTSYETSAIKIVGESYQRKTIPDISNLVARLKPFEGKENEAGTICSAIFSQTSNKLFVLSDAGEVVAYDTHSWKAEWRYDTTEWFGTIYCDDAKKILWVTSKAVLSFDGKKTTASLLPSFEVELKGVQIYPFPNGNYFLLSYYQEEIKIYDIVGNFLWGYSSPNNELLYCMFLTSKEQLLIREESSGDFKILELTTGKEIRAFTISGSITNMNIDSTDRFLSVNDLSSNSTKIIELESMRTIFEYSTKYYNADYLSSCIWSTNNAMIAIITKGEGKRRNNGYGRYISIYKGGIN